MKNVKFPNLFKPIKINSVMAMNRVFTSPMGIPKATIISSTNYGGVSIFDRSCAGAGIMTINYQALATASGYPTPFEKYARDASREVLTVLTQAGSLSNIQLFFFAQKRKNEISLMPSDGKDIRGVEAKAMTIDEIKQAHSELVKQALESQKFGFDMIMLHFAHDSLTSLFLSPVWNKRKDKYGGSLENRCRITIEAAKLVREAVGPDFPIMIRISRNLWVSETFSEDDMVYLIKKLEPYVDIVNVSYSMDCYGGTIDKYEANVHMSTMSFEPHLINIDFCERLKKETNLIIVPVGAILTPDEAEKAIADGKCDAVMLGRAMVADPQWVIKALEGRDEDIVPCLRCGHCYHISTVHNNVQCSVNPRFRRENRVPLILEKTDKPKKIVIIGGGPAGCKAALTAAEKGHHVILLEKENILGGQINFSDYARFKLDLKRYRDYLRIQISKNKNIEVRYKTNATKEYVADLNPDAIIIAIGAEPIIPDYKGIEYTITVIEAYPQLDKMKGNVVVIGSGTTGCEIALELAERNNNVSLLARSQQLAKKGNWLYRLALRQHMNANRNLHQYFNTKVIEIKKDGVVIENDKEKQNFIKADYIINATGMKPKKDSAFLFYGITPLTYMIGDCKDVNKVIEATNDGYFIASNL
jgi:2,4-dienoyl-CoA reductase-like NADH-dependent reductase (Old Yellow Enzyme family)/thioredoxin reductase